MIKQSVLIISRSYVIRKGLKSLFDELDTGYNVLFSDDGNIPVPVSAEFIFLDPEITFPEIIGQQLEGIPVFERPKIILLSWGTPGRNKNHPHVLDLSQSKSLVLPQLKDYLGTPEKESFAYSTTDPLSKREINILRLVALGNTNKEIAEKLFISTHTVITHRKNITRKLGIKTVSGLTVYAILNKIIHLEDHQ
ncbi:MAG: helix-turn-helix transcriptional regulator [Chlorobi bacterium]|nr:helix-turn-helix transcriptional regulator [Chlorobiota bacterium]